MFTLHASVVNPLMFIPSSTMPVTGRFIILICFIPIIMGAEMPKHPFDLYRKFHNRLINITNPPANASPELPVKFAPKFTRPNMMYILMMKPEGSLVRLKCSAEGNPTPNITWFKNQEAAIVRSTIPPKYAKWSLTLEEVTKADTGFYTCLVCNEMGCINHTVELSVHGKYPTKPKIEDNHPGNITALLYETVNLSCPVTTGLEPYIYWTWRSPDTIEETEVVSADPIDTPDKLTFYSVTSEYEGWYKCIALNSVGRDWAQGYLRVINDTDYSMHVSTPEKIYV